jgi:hypothetical protein
MTIEDYEKDGETLTETLVRALKEIDELKAELAETLEGYVRQECYCSVPGCGGMYDSCAISERADAMLRLAELGKFVVTTHAGRRVIGHFPEKEGDQSERR